MIIFNKVNEPYGWLGNMSPYPVVYNMISWRTTEALFQALRFNDSKIVEEIKSQKSPMGAKMIAKKFRVSMVIEPMSEKDVENMKMCVGLKIEQYSKIKKWLLETGNQEIIEDIGKRSGVRHLFWGARYVNGSWEGTNMMGKIWEEHREMLRNKNIS